MAYTGEYTNDFHKNVTATVWITYEYYRELAEFTDVFTQEVGQNSYQRNIDTRLIFFQEPTTEQKERAFRIYKSKSKSNSNRAAEWTQRNATFLQLTMPFWNVKRLEKNCRWRMDTLESVRERVDTEENRTVKNIYQTMIDEMDGDERIERDPKKWYHSKWDTYVEEENQTDTKDTKSWK